MDSLRAIEHGFTLFRCSSLGVSYIVDSMGKQRWRSETLKTGDFIGYLPRVPRHATVYGVFGDTLGWLCFGFGVLISLIAVAPSNWIRRLPWIGIAL
jgi:apolipoprotein N-acyltransferase